MERPLRVAFFPDCFDEVNGVALTSRKLVQYAEETRQSMLCVRAGRTTELGQSGTVSDLVLARSRASIPVERDLQFDVMFWRYRRAVETRLRQFQPDLIHVTGPGDIGLLGTILAHRLKVPSVASWHTNLPEYAEARLRKLLRLCPESAISDLCNAAGSGSRRLVLRFYQLHRLLLAPNHELIDWLAASTGKPVRLMSRGVDADAFSPVHRQVCDGLLRIGFVGRLSPEKNVRLLPRLEHDLLDSGLTNFRFVIVGEGSEMAVLRGQMKHAQFTGVLKGHALSQAYADMDLFVFPSETDSFGNVILEALASGVPAVVSRHGGPRHLVEHGITGLVARDEADYFHCVRALIQSPETLAAMRVAARTSARQRSWDNVFTTLYETYRTVCAAHPSPAPLSII